MCNFWGGRGRGFGERQCHAWKVRGSYSEAETGELAISEFPQASVSKRG